MSLFKKLQENSLYWRYRFVTRRYLAVKRWWRELRHPDGQARLRVVRPTPRGTASFDPYRYARRPVAAANLSRGLVFVAVAAALWTAMAHTGLTSSGFPIVTLQLVMLLAVAAAFVRFW